MLPTKKMMENCDFSDASDIPTIVNFVMAFGKEVGSVDMDYVKKFINRNVFRI